MRIRASLAQTLLLVFVLSAIPLAAGTSPSSELAAYADRLLAAAYPADQPGAAALVIKDGQVVLRKGFGMASLELGVPVAPEDVFEIGSVTKQFTAAAVLLLQERGLLRVEDEITKHLPDYPTHGERITIENLLSHTSGIPNYTSLPEWFPRLREDLSPAALMALFKDRPLDFKPGTKWSYSNSGYIVLGALIEKVSGKSYERFLTEEIFQKLGLSHTRYNPPEEVVPRRAAGYGRDAGGLRNARYLSMTQPYAAGALISTVDDLAKWDAALKTDALLSPASRERMFTPVKLSSGETTGYGYGWAIGNLAGRKVIEHGGGIFGFVCDEARVPEAGLFVAVLSNNEAAQRGPDDLVVHILAKALGEALEDRKSVQLDPRTLDDYVGVYRFDPETTRTVTRDIRDARDNAKLLIQRDGGEKRTILAAGRDDFFYKESPDRLRFQRDAQGKVTGLVLTRQSGAPTTGTRTAESPKERQAVKVDPSLFDGYVGEYELAPGFSLTITREITREGDHLFAQATGQPKFEIFPESETRFFLKVVDAEIDFLRGPDGKAASLVLHQGGRDLPGKRK